MHRAVVLHLTGVMCLAANQAVKYLGSQGSPGWKASWGINQDSLNLREYNTNLQGIFPPGLLCTCKIHIKIKELNQKLQVGENQPHYLKAV